MIMICSLLCHRRRELQKAPYVNLIIYVTRDNVTSENASSLETVQASNAEKGASSAFGDIEKRNENMGREGVFASDVWQGRPDIAYLISDYLSRCSLEDRVGVGACGPSDLVASIREAVSRKDYDNGSSIIFNSEVNPVFEERSSCDQILTDKTTGIEMVRWCLMTDSSSNRTMIFPCGVMEVLIFGN